MEKPIVKPGRVATYAGAFMAFLIGSGFATGQEVLQYFAAYGLGGGLMVSLLCVIGFIFVGGCFIAAGKRENFEKGSDIYRYYCGKYIGTFYDYFSIIFIFCSFIVMMGGAGSTIHQYFNLPNWTGSVGMMVLVCVVTLLGLNGLIEVIGKMGPAIAIIAIFLGVYSFLSNPGGVITGSEAVVSGQLEVVKVGVNPVTSAGSYLGFCMLWLAAFLAAMGPGTNSTREGIAGTTAGAIGFVLGCTSMMLGELAYMPELYNSDIPALILAGKIGGWLSFVFTIIIFCGIFTTAVPLLWQVSSRFTKEGSMQFKMTTVVCAVVGTVIALFVPFQTLVNVIYGINGYVGIILLAFIIVKEVLRISKAKKA
ncbi:hypothetical protein B5G43_02555 [Flavonifractor sp. An92]|uniref:YkvI family membrane protein n=1 Tax=Flavonifractor sp. An92 TaxID=1965666 RepID=UPI000B3708A7|nr:MULTISPECIES: hypothetical protein [unclassified Flavonifractor]OUN08282.1 hypothetical protein B5G43_02555 [Flavonifractor sp. An92]OUQ25716.1 hypothetical protein B5E80_03770 [Flavonifractor sp. An135]